MAEIISTADKVKIKDKVTAGKDKNMEMIKKGVEQGMKAVDQSVTLSTKNLVPSKRPVEKRDVDKMVKKLKNKNIEVLEKAEKKAVKNTKKKEDNKNASAELSQRTSKKSE